MRSAVGIPVVHGREDVKGFRGGCTMFFMSILAYFYVVRMILEVLRGGCPPGATIQLGACLKTPARRSIAADLLSSLAAGSHIHCAAQRSSASRYCA